MEVRPIGINDLIISTENTVYNEKKKLIEDLKKLDESEKTNEFLESIKNDYLRYQNIILKQKREQERVLLNILDYLDQLSETQSMTKYSLNHAQHEQKRLLNEIKELQNDIDKISSNL